MSKNTSRRITQLIVAGAIVLIGLSFWAVARTISSDGETVVLHGATYQVEVADTPEARAAGLSGRPRLGSNQAMLFVFDKDDYHTFQMKDMQFAVDIVWLDAQKRVVHIERDVQPDSSPHKVYKPARRARYVLELAAGQAESVKLREMVMFGKGL